MSFIPTTGGTFKIPNAILPLMLAFTCFMALFHILSSYQAQSLRSYEINVNYLLMASERRSRFAYVVNTLLFVASMFYE